MTKTIDIELFTWEKLDRVENIRKTLNILFMDIKKNNNTILHKLKKFFFRKLQIALVGAIFNQFKAESLYIQKNGLTVFPYRRVNKIPSVEGGIDEALQLPYVIHKGKRLYFPNSYSLDKCLRMYESYISEECLLGGKFLEKQPHQYLTETFTVEKGDVLVDVGCAEALLSLDSIEKVSKVYLFEFEPMWISALNATFKDYMHKVVIINKYVSDQDTDTTITLKTALRNEQGKQLFVKMDIEGAEVDVLNGSRDYFSNISNMKIACCTYHKQHDEEVIPQILSELGFDYEFSDGYMLFYDVSNMQYPDFPYFRHGLVRAHK